MKVRLVAVVWYDQAVRGREEHEAWDNAITTFAELKKYS